MTIELLKSTVRDASNFMATKQSEDHTDSVLIKLIWQFMWTCDVNLSICKTIPEVEPHVEEVKGAIGRLLMAGLRTQGIDTQQFRDAVVEVRTQIESEDN